jgi:hypothetical protein
MCTRTAISLTVAVLAVWVTAGFGSYWLAQDACHDLGGAIFAGGICVAEAILPQPLFLLIRPSAAIFVAVVSTVFIGGPVYWACRSILPRGSNPV